MKLFFEFIRSDDLWKLLQKVLGCVKYCSKSMNENTLAKPKTYSTLGFRFRPLAYLFMPSIISLSCNPQFREIPLSINKDLIPEGIAVDGNFIYLNCLYGQRIVRLNLQGREAKDIISPNENGYLAGFGIETHGGMLYAANNGKQDGLNVGRITMIDLEDGNLIRNYEIKESSPLYVNDLAIHPRGIVYATNSESNTILSTRQGDSLSILLQSSDLAYCNGIAIDDDGAKLYAASWVHGIRIIDLNSGRVLNGSHTESRGIDGLKYYQNSLIGLINSHPDTAVHGLVRFHLNEDKTDFLFKEVLITFDESFDLPTTFDIAENIIYFIKNAQVDHFQEGEPPKLLNPEELSDYRLVRYRLLD